MLVDHPGDGPEWADPRDPERHFRQHGKGVGVSTADEFAASARRTTERGRYFTYVDRWTSEPRAGYYDPDAELFTALTEDEAFIVTHFRCAERYVYDLPHSTYA